MKFTIPLFLLLSLLLITIGTITASDSNNSEDGSGEAVVTLTTSNFAQFIKENPVSLVEFYAPWCGHCKRLAPEYEAAAALLKSEGGIPFAKVDATVESELATNYGVNGYPTLKLFRNGEAEEYRGGRTKDTIVSWIKKVTGDAVVIVDNKAAAEETAKDESAVFVGHFTSNTSEQFGIFRNVAEKSRAWGKFVAFFSPSGPNTVTVYRREDGAGLSMKVDTEEKLLEFCDVERFPHFGAISGDNYNDYFTSGRTLTWFAGTKAHYDEVTNVMKEAAKSRRAENSFVWLDSEEFKDHARNYLGIKEFPGLAVHTKDGRYIFPERVFKDSSKIINFLKDVEAGKIEKFFLSEEIPEKNDEPVKVVVGKSFQEMVLRSDQDVLLEVYAPWCGHCKKFEPIYASFGESMLTAYPKLTVAKMDGTANEAPVEGFTWRGFPTVFFVKAGELTPMVYEGSRTVEALTDFVKQHASFPMSSKDEL